MLLSEKDDIDLGIYYYLWYISKTKREALGTVRISQLIYFLGGRPVTWYFNNKGKILQKSANKTNCDEIRHKFLRKSLVHKDEITDYLEKQKKLDELILFHKKINKHFTLDSLKYGKDNLGRIFIYVPNEAETSGFQISYMNADMKFYRNSKKLRWFFLRENNGDQKKDSANTENKMYFFDELELLNFCNDPEKYGNGVLQKNLNKNESN